MKDHPVDLLITDIEMPHLNGLELAGEVRKRYPGSRIPILALTSIAGEAAAREGLSRGIDEYLIKLDREELLDRLHHWLPGPEGGK